MSEENGEKECSYCNEIILNIDDPQEKEFRYCERPDDTGTGYCIFHADVNKKAPGVFREALEKLYKTTKEAYDTQPSAKDGWVFLDCQGFKFPEGGLYGLPNEIDIPVLIGDAEISGTADFKRFVFKKKGVFSNVVFKDRADFERTEFGEEVYFNQCVFPRLKGLSASFNHTAFGGSTQFYGCRFLGATLFLNTRFRGKTTFSNIEVRDHFSFNYSLFNDVLVLHRIAREFEDDLYVGWEVPIKDLYGKVDFRDIHCEKGKAVWFSDMNLSQWAFAGTAAIEEANFVNIDWKLFERGRKRTRDDELVALKEITHEECGEVYRRLRLNYEKKLAYEKASDFHIGQMEILIADPRFPDSKKFFLRLYRLLSNFGEDPWRPLLWLVVVWYFGFAALTALTLTNTIPRIEDIINGNYVTPWEYATVNLPTTKEAALITLIETLKYFWGNIWSALKNFIVFPKREGPTMDFIINTIQKLAGGILVTFAILALRRAFRR